MVKGNSRQVLVVKSPNPRLFEQAIFLLREDAAEQEGVTPHELRSSTPHRGYGKSGLCCADFSGRSRAQRRSRQRGWPAPYF